MSIQIPNLHTSNFTQAKIIGAEVFVAARKDSSNAGKFTVEGEFNFDPATGDYPTCTLSININMSDSCKGVFTSKDVQQLNSAGKVTPTLYATGKCNYDPAGKDRIEIKGCRYWLMVTKNKNERADIKQGQSLDILKTTPDIISILIFDCNGKRVAYGTGPVVSGSCSIKSKE